MSRSEPTIDLWSDDYWSPEEHEAWAAAIERHIAQNPPRPLRRATRPAKQIRCRNAAGDVYHRSIIDGEGKEYVLED